MKIQKNIILLLVVLIFSQQCLAMDPHCQDVLKSLGKNNSHRNKIEVAAAVALWATLSVTTRFQYLAPAYLPHLKPKITIEQEVLLAQELAGKSKKEAELIIKKIVPEHAASRFYNLFRRIYMKLVFVTLAYTAVTFQPSLNILDNHTPFGAQVREVKSFVDYSWARWFKSEVLMREEANFILGDFSNKEDVRKKVEQMSFDELYELIN